MVEETNALGARPSWPARQLIVMCAVSLAAGLLAGFLLRGAPGRPVQARAPMARTADSSTQAVSQSSGEGQGLKQMPHKMPTLDDFKRMADKKAAPLLEKLNSDPNNAALENQIGLIYENAHQFKEAAGYFEKSLRSDPKNIAVRADYASCLYYTGDVDGALAQLNQSLRYDPKHAGTLMNIGIIRWKGKNDVDGAVASWETLLQYHPDFAQKEALQHMIVEAKQTKTTKTASDGQKG